MALCGGKEDAKKESKVRWPMGETVRICSLENEAQATLICSVLDDKHIPYVLRTMRDSAYDGEPVILEERTRLNTKH